MKRIVCTTVLCLILSGVFAVRPVAAGGSLTTSDFTGFVPGPLPDTVSVGIVPIRWDPRCPSVNFTVNTALPPNPPGPDFVSFADVAAELQASVEEWNAIPTSYIDMQVNGTFSAPGNTFGALDFINEVNFLPSGGFLAAAPSTALTSDFTLPAGFDFDGDGDSDFFDPSALGIEVCTDVDGDGDIEFPAGFYKAGTIFDTDVFFNQNVTWTVDVAQIDAGPRVDLQAVAVHEFGHSHGLAHSLIDQISENDGTGATMFPFIDTFDPDAELSQRSLASDDIAWSSFLYPEGSAVSGPGALGPGDVPFDEVFGVISGEVTHGATGLPLAGGSVWAIDRQTGEAVASQYTGTTRLFFDFNSGFVIDPNLPEFHLVDGGFTLPVPGGRYNVAIEAIDGSPAASTNISTTAVIGDSFGLLDFNEEFFRDDDDSDDSDDSDSDDSDSDDSDSDSDSDSDDDDSDGGFEARQVKVEVGETVSGVDHVTSVDVNVDPFDTVGSFSGTIADLDAFGIGFAGRVWAVQFPAQELLDVLDQGLVFKSAAFRTFLFDASVAAIYPQAGLVTGVAEGGFATLDIADPIVRQRDFLGQQNDFSPLFFSDPAEVAEEIREAVEEGVSDFFLILELPEEILGASGFSPAIGLDAGQQAGLLGRSYLSNDFGATFSQFTPFNWMFRLIAAPEADDDDQGDDD